MPTVSQLKTRLEYLVDDSLDNELVLALFNECQEDLSEVAGYAKTQTATFEKGDPTIYLPGDLIELVELKMKTTGDYKRLANIRLIQSGDLYDNDYNYQFSSFEWFGDTIGLRPTPKEDGELLLRYYARLPELESVEDTSLLRTRFHRLFPLFGAARYMQNWRDGLSEKNDFYGEYMRGKMELENDTQNRKAKTRSRTVYRFRHWR